MDLSANIFEDEVFEQEGYTGGYVHGKDEKIAEPYKNSNGSYSGECEPEIIADPPKSDPASKSHKSGSVPCFAEKLHQIPEHEPAHKSNPLPGFVEKLHQIPEHEPVAAAALFEPIDYNFWEASQNGDGNQAADSEKKQRTVSSAKPTPVFEDGVIHSSELTFHKVLGSGAQGDVFLSTWKRSFGCSSCTTTVAVKRLAEHACTHLDREALLLRTDHPNLVQCFGAWTADAPFLLVLEFCSGGSLYNQLHHPEALRLTWKQRVKILCDVAEGMKYLHSHQPKIIHRDLKSTNILLLQPVVSEDCEPHAKITDFGLARVQEEVSTWGPMTQCVGTWRWTAPEVFASTHYNEKADIYSFAMVMYELLTSLVPFADNWPDTKTTLTPRIGLWVVKGLRPKVTFSGPEPLKDLMVMCWENEAQRRPTFEEVAEILNGLSEIHWNFSASD